MNATEPRDAAQNDSPSLREPEATTSAEQAAAGAVPQDESAHAPTAPTDPLAALQRENGQLRDQYLRAVAEARNLKQRFERERLESLRYAEADFARELLVILDDLDRTLGSAPSTDAPPILEGLRILRESFLKILRARGVEPIEALGKPFNPELHEALMQQPSESYPAQTVCQELARGYRMHERVLRPARVVVSSGKP